MHSRDFCFFSSRKRKCSICASDEAIGTARHFYLSEGPYGLHYAFCSFYFPILAGVGVEILPFPLPKE
jgi:hypothetical protein